MSPAASAVTGRLLGRSPRRRPQQRPLPAGTLTTAVGRPSYLMRAVQCSRPILALDCAQAGSYAHRQNG